MLARPDVPLIAQTPVPGRGVFVAAGGQSHAVKSFHASSGLDERAAATIIAEAQNTGPRLPLTVRRQDKRERGSALTQVDFMGTIGN